MGSLQDLAPAPQFEEGSLHSRGVATLRLSTQHVGLRSPARERSGGAHKRGAHTDGPNTIHPFAFVLASRCLLFAGPFLRIPVRGASSLGDQCPTVARSAANARRDLR